ncbi:MAG: inositol monophosphatase [Rhodospirillales bacterium]|nr:inositol monophosphatase [Rhodospirillales bacterium]
MSVIDLSRVTEIIREVGQSEILPRFRNLEAHQIREKGPGNLVTEADIEAERQLGRRLSELMPGSVVVGEEAVAADHKVLAALAGNDPVWILDPVDGTANFAHHRPVFGVIVALAMEGTTVAGWIHDPLSDTTAVAAAGEGAWIGDRRLHVAEERELSAMAGSLGYRKDPYVAGQVQRLVRNGSVAHDYLALAEGRLDFACYRRLMPWDHAAGVLLHSEAGGWNALLDGSPYHPLPAATGVLLAPGEASWMRLRDLIATR